MGDNKGSFYSNLQYAALLHDIGKIWQRTKYNKSEYQHPDRLNLSTENIGLSGAHAKWSAEFCDKYLDLEPEVRDAVLFHHNPSNAPSENAQKIALLVQIADWLSSSERQKMDGNKTASPINEPLISIFSNITNIKEKVEWKNQKNHFYPLTNLNFRIGNDAILLPKPNKKAVMSGSNLTPDYTYIWEALERELKHIKTTGVTFELLLQLLEKYSWAIPQATYKHLPDISLYDHLKTTCAIASCLYFSDLSVNECQELKNNILNHEETKKTSFLLVKGDISGVHKFIFTIISKLALKTLKGRSIFLEFLTESIARTILREFDLPLTNILYCGGGNFYLLLPAKAEEQLAILRKKISRILLKKLGEDLYFAIDWIQLTASDFYPENFGSKWDEVSTIVDNKKQTQYIEINLEENYERFFEPFEEGGRKKQCDICHKEIYENNTIKWEENEVCQLCDSFKEIVNKLRTIKEIYISSNESKGNETNEENTLTSILDDLGTKISLEPTGKSTDQVTYNILENGLPKIPFKLISKGIPYDQKTNQIRDLDTLASSSIGADMLAMLKMDIDSLGKIFRFGLKENNTISRISTLSSMITRFFSGYLDELIVNNEKYKENCYTIFAGGDDLLIVGSWSTILDLAYDVYENFRKFTCYNPHITLSAGILVFNNRYPIIRGAIEAEEALEKAKNYQENKNSLNIFGENFKWDIFEKKKPKEIIELFKQANYLENLNEYSLIWYIKELLVDMLQNGCSRSILHKIASSVKGLKGIIRESVNGVMEIPKVWRLRYYLRDHFDDKSKFKDHVNCLVKIYEGIIEKNLLSTNPSEKITNANCILVAVRWAELLTKK